MHPLFPHLDRSPGRVAIRLGDAALTYGELARAARAHAARMAAAGLGRGARVALFATIEVPTVVALVGNALAGLVTVPLNPALGDKELAHVLGDAAPAAILAADPAALSARIPAVRGIWVDTGGAGAGTIETVAEDDPLFIIYTSGTTGAPKGAVLTHGNAAFDLDALADAWGLTADDELVQGLPLFHVHGLIVGLLGLLRAGGTVRLLPRFSPAAVGEAFAAGATLMYGVPTMYHRLCEHGEAHPGERAAIGRARLLVSGSAPLSSRERVRLEELFGQRVVERYGLTETLILCAQRHDGARRVGCVGPALPGVELRLVDDHGGALDGAEGPGEVLVRGPSVFSGYLNRPEATAAAIDADGFFHTGDVAVVEAGELRILGRRATDLVKTGGYKVGLGEVEAALLDHPAVREAAAIGVPDEDLGERIVAFVVLVPGRAVADGELADHVAHLLAPHKRPRAVHLVEALPRNAMGKILKKELAGRVRP